MTLLILFGQHSAESAICCLGVCYVCSRGGFNLGFGSPFSWFHGSLYLLRGVFIILEDSGEKF